MRQARVACCCYSAYIAAAGGDPRCGVTFRNAVENQWIRHARVGCCCYSPYNAAAGVTHGVPSCGYSAYNAAAGGGHGVLCCGSAAPAAPRPAPPVPPRSRPGSLRGVSTQALQHLGGLQRRESQLLNEVALGEAAEQVSVHKIPAGAPLDACREAKLRKEGHDLVDSPICRFLLRWAVPKVPVLAGALLALLARRPGACGLTEEELGEAVRVFFNSGGA